MGDKSPKAQARQKKQDTAQKTEKTQKKASAFAKAHPPSSAPPKKGK